MGNHLVGGRDVRALAVLPRVLAEGSGPGDLELGQVEGLHRGQVEAALPLADLEEGHLNRRRPREGEVPGLRALGLVDCRQASRGVLEGLPPREVVGGLHGAGEDAVELVDVGLRDLLHGVGGRALLARVDHVGLEERALHEHPVEEHLVEELGLDLHVDAHGRLEVVLAGEGHVGLHDGHEPLGLADERVPGEVPHVGLDHEVGGLPRGQVDGDGRAPLGELAASVLELLAARREGVEPLHHGCAVLPGKRVDLEMGLDPGHDPELLEGLREKLAAGGRGLVEGLGVEDRRREVVSGAGGLEQHLAVCPAVLLRVLDADSLKARADGRGPLVTRGDALAGGADEGAHALKLDLLSGGEEGAVVAGGGAPGGPPVRRSRLDLSGHAATSSRASTRSLDGEGHGGAHQGAGPDRHGSRPHPTCSAILEIQLNPLTTRLRHML
mmetsp:Transcript_58181/g.185290  ORF Transcript_58181/g.185290 Transcript_58181/m.185290 type:complete len:441 (+) Transcript_58181:934-2256(+)